MNLGDLVEYKLSEINKKKDKNRTKNIKYILSRGLHYVIIKSTYVQAFKIQ